MLPLESGQSRCALKTAVETFTEIFIVAPCIFEIYVVHTHQQMHYLLTWLKVLNLHLIHNNIALTCFGL